MTNPTNTADVRAALIEARDWFESQAKDASKGCGPSYELHDLREQRDALDAALASPAQTGEYPELPEPTVHEDEVWRIEYFTESQMHAYVDADRAAREVAQSAPVDANVQQDAERYRWLREYAIGAYTSVFRGNSSAAVYLLTKVPALDGIGEETDAAIDAARATQKEAND